MNSLNNRAKLSRAALERLYIAMQHLFIRGSYKPLGASGEVLIKAMLELSPEIYGSICDSERVEIDGLLYVFQRLPIGIESTKSIKLISREGLESSNFEVLVPSKRRRNCYRIDEDQMFIEVTRGRSDIYDVLSHLTFLFIEAKKIRTNSLDSKGNKRHDWKMLEKFVHSLRNSEKVNLEAGFAYLSTALGRTHQETVNAYHKFRDASKVSNIFEIVYGLGSVSIEEFLNGHDREISFSSVLREKTGHHIIGNNWANNIKSYLKENDLIDRPTHLISSNLHSVMNCLFAKEAFKGQAPDDSLNSIAEELSLKGKDELREVVSDYAKQHGMIQIDDRSGANINVQIYDLQKMKSLTLPEELSFDLEANNNRNKVLIVMDYAFGEQAFECMDELLKPFENQGKELFLNLESINIMGKAGILDGNHGDIMIPNAHVFEGTADNYPFSNDLDPSVFEAQDLKTYCGPMITVLGTSLQNKDILSFFHKSSWKAVGLEMEGAHYQKAIQAAFKVRARNQENITVRYCYYASDNPLESGKTLASGGLGLDGVKPTYAITTAILNKIFGG